MAQKKLFKSDMNVFDMMGTMSNTLILAFTGGSLTTMLVLYSYGISFNQLFSSPSVALQIIQGMTGSIGAFISVPAVALITSVALKLPKKIRKKAASSGGKITN